MAAGPAPRGADPAAGRPAAAGGALDLHPLLLPQRHRPARRRAPAGGGAAGAARWPTASPRRRRRRCRAPLDLRAPAPRRAASPSSTPRRGDRALGELPPAACSTRRRAADRPAARRRAGRRVARRGDRLRPAGQRRPAGATCGWTCRPGCWRGSAARSRMLTVAVLSINAALVGAAALLPPPPAAPLGDAAGAGPPGGGAGARRGRTRSSSSSPPSSAR